MFDYERLYALKFTKLYLNFCGVALGEQKNSKIFALYKYYLLACFTTLTTFQLMTYVDVRDMPSFAKTTGFILSAFFLNFCTLYVHFREKEFLEIMQLKNENFYVYSNDVYDSYAHDVDERFRRVVQKYGKVFVTLYVMIEITPLLVTPFSDYELGSPETLMLPCKFPWKIDTVVSYLLTYLLQVSCIAPISCPVFGMVFLTVYFMIEIRAQEKKLCCIIDDIKFSSQRQALMLTCRKFGIGGDFNGCRYSRYREISDFLVTQYNRISMEKLIHCSKHHQKIIKFVNNFVLYVEAMFIGNLIYSICTITLNGYVIVGGVVKSSLYSQYGAVIGVVLVYLLLFCHLGELISDFNYHVRESLYDTDWYNLKNNFRKTLAFLMCNTMRYKNVKATQSYVASYQLFTGIIKGCYSYVNLLLQTFSIKHD